MEAFGNLVEELLGGKVMFSLDIVGVVDDDGQILGHESVLNGLDNNSFKGSCEGGESFVAVELSSVGKTSRPGEN